MTCPPRAVLPGWALAHLYYTRRLARELRLNFARTSPASWGYANVGLVRALRLRRAESHNENATLLRTFRALGAAYTFEPSGREWARADPWLPVLMVVRGDVAATLPIDVDAPYLPAVWASALFAATRGRTFDAALGARLRADYPGVETCDAVLGVGGAAAAVAYAHARWP